MRNHVFVAGGCLVAAGLILPPNLAQAAAIKGRVVDSAGQPVAGAEVNVWQKLPAADGRSLTNQHMKFVGREVLRTDENGTFASPDVLVNDAFARIVVEADGLLAARSDWFEVRKGAPLAIEDIVLKRLRSVIGKVIDRQNRPVADATVFDSSDGRERVETKTDAEGKFRLQGVPEGGVFLFAEKPGYRFVGIHLPADQSAAALVLAGLDERVEPVAALQPLLSDDEERAMARQAIDRWLEQVGRSGANPIWPLRELSNLDPLDAYDRSRTIPLANEDERIRLQGWIVHECIRQHERFTWDELRALIDRLDQSWVAGAYLEMGQQLDHSQEPRRRQCLTRALENAQRKEKPVDRTLLLSAIAAELYNVGEERRAAEVMFEAEKSAQQLPPNDQESQRAFHLLAIRLGKRDPARAMAWLEKIERDWYYVMHGGELAAELVPDHPDAAEEMWNRTRDRLHGNWKNCHMGERGVQLVDLCFRMAQVDLPRAERMARNAEVQPHRLRALGAVALRWNETEPAAARRLLKSLIRDELPRPDVDDDFQPFGLHRLAPPLTAAWLLPIAAQIDPQLGRECFWRSLAMRPPRPPSDRLDDGDAEVDIDLAMMLSRYDRGVARALLAPLAARLPEFSRPTLTELKSRSASAVAMQSRSLERTVVAAASHIDPVWARELHAGLPGEEELSLRGFPVVEALAVTLCRPRSDRWQEPGAFFANYWKSK